MGKRGWVVGTITAGAVLVAGGLLVVNDLDPRRALGLVDAPGPRPAFAMPFTCGERWRLSTYNGHDPEDKKLDMFRMDGRTHGSIVRATAPGTVSRLVDPGGVKIDHGGRWHTLSLHMDSITVEPGDEVVRGQAIGRVGSVGTRAAHLHYEQLYDSSGDGFVPTAEMVHPVIQGTRYDLQPGNSGRPWPKPKSTNSCRA